MSRNMITLNLELPLRLVPNQVYPDQQKSKNTKSKSSSLGRSFPKFGKCPSPGKFASTVNFSVKLRVFSDILDSSVARTNYHTSAFPNQRPATKRVGISSSTRRPEAFKREMPLEAGLLPHELESTRAEPSTAFSRYSWRPYPLMSLSISNAEGIQQTDTNPHQRLYCGQIIRQLGRVQESLQPSTCQSRGEEHSGLEVVSANSESDDHCSDNSMLEELIDDATEDWRSAKLLKKLDSLETAQGFQFKKPKHQAIGLNSSSSSVVFSIDMCDEEPEYKETIQLVVRTQRDPIILQEGKSYTKNLLIPVIPSN